VGYIRVQTTRKHIRFVFYHSINVKEMFVRAEKGIGLHIDVSIVVWTLVCKGKLASQIARLVAIVVKKKNSDFFLVGGENSWIVAM